MTKIQFFTFTVVIFLLGGMVGWRVCLAFTLNEKSNIETVKEIIDCNQCYDNLKDYQLAVSRDSTHVFKSGKLIGVTSYGHNGIDSIINKDNE